ncbi:MAG: Rne/Rng family ribonuclease [Alphaproteobacteria bacterium]|nr:Rne/Rng family ribonuclease [Alphaproteobacteria bacterium]
MTKRMLIDATNAEETRVVVLDGTRLEDFDVETSTKKQLKGNIYLAKVVRVEPSLQAAFVEYGGGRHGFLAFGEIHPDYYQIPVADRQRLIAMQAEEARAEAEAEEAEDAEEKPAPRRERDRRREPDREPDREPAREQASPLEVSFGEVTYGAFDPDAAPTGDVMAAVPADEAPVPVEEAGAPEPYDAARDEVPDEPGYDDLDAPPSDQAPPEALGGESDVFEGNGAEEARARRSSRFLRNYRIQEVIRRRQILLIQVVKEERGTKGAALTTYISLAGRFCVLMPNSPRGGGISRKITSAADRRRLKEITAELEIPQGMGLIVRTAGAARPKPEIKRDCEYLMRLWDDIREHTMQSMAPALIYEEASLIKRAIRDGYSRDIDEVLVDGRESWKAAHDFMRMLMPAHARKVIQWREAETGGQSLFSRMGVEAQLDAMLSPNVQLKSGGYLVINQAEALVAIDVNSGRSTRERNIEETALRTNLEAAEEAARQLRLRDLAGLIVIDFIDMESRKNNAMVERRLKDSLKNDRARIQVGSISHFGLLEMSRQRLRPSLTETNFVTCPHCSGLGHVRSVESSAMHVLRAVEEEGAKARSALITVHVAGAVAMYLLNHKRDRLVDIETRTGMRVHFAADDSLAAPQVRVVRERALEPGERPTVIPIAAAPVATAPDEIEEEDVAFAGDVEEPAAPAADDAAAGAEARDEESRRRGRRRRRGGRREDGEEAKADAPAVAAPIADGESETTLTDAADAPPVEVAAADAAAGDQPTLDENALDENGRPRARRRGRRGGRRRRRDEDGNEIPDTAEASAEGDEAPPAVTPAPAFVAPVFVAPAYSGPTPADPFGGQQIIDIFDIMEQQAEAEQAAATVAPRAAEPVAVVVEAVEAIVVAAPESAAELLIAPTAPEQAAAAPVPVDVAIPEVAIPEVVAPEAAPEAPKETHAAAEPAAAAVSEPDVGPAIKPIVLGEDPAPASPPKRGWWRR